MAQRAACQGADSGQHIPFGLPSAQRALVLLNHGGQHGRHQGRYAGRGGQDGGAGDGVAFVRHGARAAATRAAGFGQFRDFGLRHQRDIAGNLAQRAGQHAQRGGYIGEPVAMRVPRHVGQRQTQLFGKG
ncbi:hypothetical protein D3C71_1680670 [compost metagenome]